MQLQTRYLGFQLPNPFLVGASPLAYDTGLIARLEEAGAAAVVMHSLFEEQIVRENVCGIVGTTAPNCGIFPESGRFPLGPEAYLEQIQKLKQAVSIPVIASLNGIHLGTWVEYARLIEGAGADALEVNLYFTPRSDNTPSGEIEKRALKIVRTVRDNTRLPLAVKIAPFYTGLPRFVARLEESGANAIVLFNSFFQPDIDIEAMAFRPSLSVAEPHALLLRTRWIATLHGRTRLDLSLSGGVNAPADAIKGLMAGATTLQIVSSLLHEGPAFLKAFIREFTDWMDDHGFTGIDQLRGILGFQQCTNTEAMARAGYLRMLQDWQPEPPPR
jgi:dihydroorotate dehydrogenase (fumarate)